MYRFLTMVDTPLTWTLVQRLQDAGIAAQCTVEHPPAGLCTGIRQAIIWLEDESQRGEAAAIYRAVFAERPRSACPGCGYSLSGHVGVVRCPECGRPTVAPIPDVEDVPCPNCREPVPVSFDLCWNCGETMRP